ncbi:MSCRAMM family protein [Geobacter pickeringii]|uniref:Alpha-amylase n=1 Tax=Geobacter pickeringii TaxID=345632 RepID=A0A0B5BCL8_9BACT|nr:carboxypeptidase regulatory-like domain-containing protein [Geobacter pickeringii]AJE02315.1 hypothetical protein GPICK_02035 [Geobacter pickeringii]
MSAIFRLIVLVLFTVFAISSTSSAAIVGISGVVRDSTDKKPLQNVTAFAYDSTTGTKAGEAKTDLNGYYLIMGLTDGSYVVEISTEGYEAQWFNNKRDRSLANPVTVTAPYITVGTDALLVKKGGIAGRITERASGTALGGAQVTIYDAVTGAPVGSQTTALDGTYTIGGISSGNYKVKFESPANGGFLPQWYDNNPTQDAATVVSVMSPAVAINVNAALVHGGSILGTVRDSYSGQAIPSVRVELYDAATGGLVTAAYGGADGTYVFNGLQNGTYKVAFKATGYFTQWYPRKSDTSSATEVRISALDSITGADAELMRDGWITGSVTDAETGAGVSYVAVNLYEAATGNYIKYVFTNSVGAYTFTAVPNGVYKIQFSPYVSYARQWYKGKDDISTATPVTVDSPAGANGVDASLAKAGRISGMVSDKLTNTGIDSVVVEAYESLSGRVVANAVTSRWFGYSIYPLPPGSYKIRFKSTTDGYLGQWYDNRNSANDATIVTVSAGGETKGINAALMRGGVITGRVTDAWTNQGIPNLAVEAYDASTGLFAGSATTTFSVTFPPETEPLQA